MIDPIYLVGIGGAAGAVCRHQIGLWLSDHSLPTATFFVNVVGSFVLGLVTFASVGDQLHLLVGIGACGSFTTYSTFSVESVQLWDTGDRFRAAIYAVGTLLICALAVGLAAGLMYVV